MNINENIIKNKIALITGITGQDGSYLAEFLLEKGYIVHGIKRRSSSFNTERIDHIYQDPHNNNPKFHLHYGDLIDSTNLIRLIKEIHPDEIYNLAAQSHVAVSFETPEYTANCDALGVLRILEAVRILGLEKKTKVYQASTSELFGKVKESPQNELTPFNPQSPYGVAKLYAYWIIKNYREAYGMYACNGILFNHESPRRGETFVTRKITRGLVRIDEGIDDCLYLGNLNSLRDWGHAKDFVEMQWLMLQQKKPDDYVIATGRQKSIKDFIQMTAFQLGWNKSNNSLAIYWKGEGLDEVGVRADNNKIVIKVDKRYFRPSEVDSLLGDPSKAINQLGWKPKISLESLIQEMIENDRKIILKEFSAKKNNLF